MQTTETNQIETLRDMYAHGGNLHHAYLLESGSLKERELLISFLEEDVGVVYAHNPDFWIGFFETFGIDDAHTLGERVSRKSLLGGRKIFILEARFMTREAQNALLKLLEEPTADTHFFILMNGADTLLPTVQSRLMRIAKETSAGGMEESRLWEFLCARSAERIAFLSKAPEFKDKDDSKQKNKYTAIQFLNGIERLLYVREERISQETAKALEEITLCRGYLFDQSSSVKMILEHIALALPLYKKQDDSA